VNDYDIAINTTGIKIYWSIYNKLYDFSRIKNIAELKRHLNDHIVECKNCGLARECKHFKMSCGNACTVLVKLFHNFIDSILYRFDLNNQNQAKKFLSLVIKFIELNYYFQNWRGLYIDDELVHSFRGMHFTNHSLYSKKILESISRFVIDLNVIDELHPKFYVFVEGDSEEVALPILFHKNQFLVYENYEIVNLKGKDTIQRPSIRELLKNFNISRITPFLILDNDKSIQKFVNDLIVKKLIERRNVIIWKKDFEDSVPIEFSIPLLAGILNREIDVNIIRKYNKSQQGVLRALKKYFHDNKVDIDVRAHKKAWAKSIAENIDNCYGKIYKYKPKFELEKQIFRLKKMIQEKNLNFYMPTKDIKRWKEEIHSTSMDKPYKVIE